MQRPRRIDAVLFDLFDTLVTVDASLLPVLRVEDRCVPSTLPAVLAELRRALPTVADAHTLREMAAVRAHRPSGPENAEIAEHVAFGVLLQRLGVRDDRDELARRLADAQMAAVVAACRPVRGARALLAALRANRVRTAVVSNLAHAASLNDLLATADPQHRFEATVTSIEVGYCKPSERPFKLALARLGVEPQHSIHIGDDVRDDVAGALGAGIYPVWFNPHRRAWPGSAAAVPTTVAALAEAEALLRSPESMAV